MFVSDDIDISMISKHISTPTRRDVEVAHQQVEENKNDTRCSLNEANNKQK